MAVSHDQVERIVRDVLAQLGAAPLRSSASDRTGSPQPERRSAPDGTTAVGGALELSGNLISLAELAGRLQGITQLVLSRQAVITPSARDLLAQSRVDVVRSAAVGRPQTCAKGLRLITAGWSDIAQQAAQILARRNVELDIQFADDWPSVIHGIARQGQEIPCLLWSDQTAVVLCMANRHGSLRAALAHDCEDMAVAWEALRPNVWVCDPRRLARFGLVRLIEAIATAGVGPCPAGWAQHLS